MLTHTYNRQLQDIVAAYRDAGQRWPPSKHDIANWAFREGLWQPRKADVIDLFADQLARAMREEYYTDPQGRTVRAKHVARRERDGKTLPLWDDIRTAERPHMEAAFQQRRQQVMGDCRQLKTDVDSYNENGNPGSPIQLNLNFTLDVEELQAVS